MCPVYSIDCIIDNKNNNNIHRNLENIFGIKIDGAPGIFTNKNLPFGSYCIGFTD